MLTREKRDGREELWVGKMLSLFRCPINGENVEDRLAFLHYEDCVATSDEAGKALRCVRLQWATTDSGQKRKDGERGQRYIGVSGIVAQSSKVSKKQWKENDWSCPCL